MWLRDENFKSKFQEGWGKWEEEGWEGYKFMMKMEETKKVLIEWNKVTFGDTRLEKGAIIEKIESFDRKEISTGLEERDRAERSRLRRRLEEILARDEASWFQKTKLRGVVEWDNNSKLFHRIASGRKASKLINKIEDTDGRILQTEGEIERVLVDFYKKLYDGKSATSIAIEGVNWGEISRVDSANLERPFTLEEVREALFSCDGDKAPGPDGFTMAALQGAWEIIKEDVMKVFEEFYRTGVINKRTNATYICLIPKKINSIAVKDYRPISLVSSLYKLIAKTLAIRLKKVLPGTIDNSQGAFVEGRQILDLALIANEVVEEYRSKKKQGVVVKVDFEKAYDHVNWEFLQFVLAKKVLGRNGANGLKGA